ncbi:type II toxin-antitoxin system VapC family toxin [Sphingorhabdus sp. IMCC26285]|uniref:Type II toxin-antitoxin system VapC family toxin n=1 Tax=Sphingorhabdus profundilacus TaxID=2509718 RepID=A0A6I4LYC2_9SPHN|nr:type II toxin-antitoxin system VapC family toxin [Sphingorhabdus profundilacus]
MIALDTSVLARYILNDTIAEADIAAQLISENECFVSWTVLLELCWVLESRAGLPRKDVVDILTTLSQSKMIIMPNIIAVTWAIDRYNAGADFADMIHLASTSDIITEFVSFDRKFAQQAGSETPLAVRTLRS